MNPVNLFGHTKDCPWHNNPHNCNCGGSHRNPLKLDSADSVEEVAEKALRPYWSPPRWKEAIKSVADALRAERKNSFLQELQESDAIQVKLTKENADLRAQLEAEQQKYKDMHAELVEECEEYQEESDLLCKQLAAERERGELAQIALLRISAVFQDVSEFSCETINCSILKSRGKQVFELATSAMLPAKPEVGE